MIQKIIKFMTHEKIEFVNITKFIEGFIKEDPAEISLVNIFSPHTTAALILNEDEPGLKEDILKFSDLLTQHIVNFGHNRVDHNASAHLTQIIYGYQMILPIRSGKLLIGDWQSILFIEFDGPRERRVILTSM